MSERIRAFTLRRKMSKQGKQYYTAPYGDVDLLAFTDETTGDIVAYYSPREAKSATAAYRAPQAQATSRPKITPRANPVQIREPSRVATPHHRPEPQDFVDHTASFDNSPMPTDDDFPGF
jgi:hypothetical protein